LCALERTRIEPGEKKRGFLTIFVLFYIRSHPPPCLCIYYIVNRTTAAHKNENRRRLSTISSCAVCVCVCVCLCVSALGNCCCCYCCCRDCRLSSVDRVIYKALVRPPQVITSARPELGFLPAQHHATGTSGISFIGSFLLTFLLTRSIKTSMSFSSESTRNMCVCVCVCVYVYV